MARQGHYGHSRAAYSIQIIVSQRWGRCSQQGGACSSPGLLLFAPHRVWLWGGHGGRAAPFWPSIYSCDGVRVHDRRQTLLRAEHSLIMCPCFPVVLLQVGVGCPPVMDDTVAMQDTNGPIVQAPVSKGDVSENSIMASMEQLADTSSSRPDYNACAPQSPSTALQQVCDRLQLGSST